MTNKVEVLVDGVVQQTLDLKFAIENLPVGVNNISLKSYNNDTLIDEQTRTVEVLGSGGGEPTPTDGLAVDFQFDELSGGLINKVTGTEYTFDDSFTNRDGNVYDVDAGSFTIDCGDNGEFDLFDANGDIPFTIRTKIAFSTSGGELFSKGDDTNGYEYRMRNTGDPSKWEFQLYDNQGIGGLAWLRITLDDTSVSSILTDGTDIGELVITYDGSGKHEGLKAYYNGVEAVYTTDANNNTYVNCKNTPAPFKLVPTNREPQADLFQLYKGVAWTAQEVADNYGV